MDAAGGELAPLVRELERLVPRRHDSQPRRHDSQAARQRQQPKAPERAQPVDPSFIFNTLIIALSFVHHRLITGESSVYHLD